MNIEENNKLIAEFMGWSFSKSGKTARIGKGKGTSAYRLKDLHFSTSYDWLMPVVEKIEDIQQMGCQAYVYIAPFNVEVYCSGNHERGLSQLNYQLRGRKFAGKDKIDAVCDCVIQFINWYNNN